MEATDDPGDDGAELAGAAYALPPNPKVCVGGACAEASMADVGSKARASPPRVCQCESQISI